MSRHVPVLLKEVIEALALQPHFNVVDCTLGDAGHAEAILEIIGPKGKLLGIDADPESLLRAKQYLYRFSEQTIFVRDNFAHLEKIVGENKFAPVNAVVMDLGWSTSQFSERGRGFSFETDEPLDMRYHVGQKSEVGGPKSEVRNPKSDTASEITAAEIVNTYDFDDLYRIFRHYGEEDLSREIANAIIETRKKEPITKTGQLTEIILQVYRKKLKTDKAVPWIGGLHPATKVFQALRIETNKELEVLKQVLPQAVEVLAPGGRLAVISFHSLEDRIVKQFFKSIENKQVHLVTKQPVGPSVAEVAGNPRSRSAKLRVVEKLP